MNNEVDNSRFIVHSQRGLQFEKIHQQSNSARIIAAAREKIKSSRSRYLKEKVTTSAGDPKNMWRTTRDLLHSSPTGSLDDGDCDKMATTFSQFFSDKVEQIKESIRSALSRVPLIGPPLVDVVYSGPHLTNFGEVSVKEVKNQINSMSNKSSPLDVLPTSLLRSCVEVFAARYCTTSQSIVHIRQVPIRVPHGTGSATS